MNSPSTLVLIRFIDMAASTQLVASKSPRAHRVASSLTSDACPDTMPPSSDTHKTEDPPSIIISNGEVQPVRVPSVILKTPRPTATVAIPSPLTEISEPASQHSQSSLQDTPCPPPRTSRHILPTKADVPIEPRTIFSQEPLAVVSPTHTIPSWLRDGGSLANAVGALEMEYKTVQLRGCELQATVQALNIEKEGLQAKVGLLERQATVLRADIGSFSAMARELRAGLQRSEARVKELETVVQDLTTDNHSLVEDARKQNIELQTCITKAERLGKTLEQAQVSVLLRRFVVHELTRYVGRTRSCRRGTHTSHPREGLCRRVQDARRARHVRSQIGRPGC